MEKHGKEDETCLWALKLSISKTTQKNSFPAGDNDLLLRDSYLMSMYFIHIINKRSSLEPDCLYNVFTYIIIKRMKSQAGV